MDQAAQLAAAMANAEGLDNIWTAASDGELEKVKGYLASGIDVNAQDETGYSPLHAAASYGHDTVSCGYRSLSQFMFITGMYLGGSIFDFQGR